MGVVLGVHLGYICGEGPSTGRQRERGGVSRLEGYFLLTVYTFQLFIEFVISIDLDY